MFFCANTTSVLCLVGCLQSVTLILHSSMLGLGLVMVESHLECEPDTWITDNGEVQKLAQTELQFSSIMNEIEAQLTSFH